MSNLRICLLFFLLVTTCSTVRANHVLGGNITWDCLGGNNFGITLTVYKDCFGATPAPPDITLFFFPSDIATCGLPFSTEASFVSEVEISDLCASELVNSSCNGGLSPGTQLLTYYSVVNLNPACQWTVQAVDPGDWNYFVNVDYSLLPDALFQTTIDPTTGCDDSVEITSLQVQYYCMADAVSQQITVDNPNGYTLTYSFTSVLTELAAGVGYEAGYSGAIPIPGISISAGGLITFTAPMMFGNYVVGVQIDMYDSGGNFVGSILESMAFVIQICVPFATTFTNPGVLSASPDVNIISGTEVSVCAGDLLCFDVEATNANLARVITMTSDFTSLFPGGTFTQNGTNPAEGQCCIQTDESMIGDYVVEFEATDDACNFPGYDQLLVTVHILPNLTVSVANAIICNGQTLSVTATGDSAFQWNVISGDFTPNFGCATCGNQTMSPDQNTVIEVVAANATNTCNYRDTLTVTVYLTNITAVASEETCNGNDGSINLTIGSGSGAYTYNWDFAPDVQDPTGLAGGTYNVTITDLGIPGCTATASAIVTSDPPPSGNITGSATICEGQSANILFNLSGTGPFAINMTPAGPPTANNGNTFSVTPAVTTTYTLNSITDSNVPQCTYSTPSTVTITVNPTVSAVFLAAGPICEGDDVDLILDINQPGNFNVNYSVDGVPQTQILANDGTTLNFTPADDASYSITSIAYTGNPQCPNNTASQVVVIVNDTPDAVLTGATTICAGDNTDLTVTLTGTGPWQVDYSENGIPSGTLIIAGSPYLWNVAPALTTAFCLTNVTDQGVNCSAAINSCQQVIVNPVPAITFGSDITICPGDNTNLIINLTSTPGLYNVLMQSDDGMSIINSNLNNLADPYNYNVAPATTTTYTLISVEYSANPGLCVTTVNEDVVVIVALEITATLLDTICAPNGQTYQVTVQLSGGTPGTYTASPFTTGPGSFAGNLYTSANVPTGASETWIFSDINNCNPISFSVDAYTCPIFTWSGTLDPDTLIVCGNAPAFGVFNNDSILDADDQQMFILHDSPTDIPGFIYAFDCNDSGFNDGDTPLVFGMGFGQIQWGVVYYISSVVGDDDGSGDCVNLNASNVSISEGQPVIFVQIPTADMSGGGAVCIGGSVNVQLDFTGNAPWVFTYTIDGVAQPSITTNNDPYIISTQTDGMFVLTSVNSYGCGGAVAGNANVIINPLPAATIGVSGEVCIGQLYNFQVNLIGTPNWNFDIVYDNGAGAVTNTVNGIAVTPYNFATGNAGTYYITSVTDGNSCTNTSDSAPVTLLVNPLPTAQFAFDDTSFCQGSSINLIINLTGESDWDIAYTINGGAAQNWNTAATPFDANITNGGMYTITSVTDNNGCVSNPMGETISVTELIIPAVDAGPDEEICTGGSVAIGTPATAGTTYLWDNAVFLDDEMIAEPTAAATNAGPGDTQIVFTLTASNAQCNVTDDMILTVHPLPIIEAGANDTICFGGIATLNASGGVSYDWTDNGFFIDPLTDPSPQVNPNVTATFFVTGTDANNCVNNDSVVITVPAELLVVENFTAQVCHQVCDGTIDLVPQGGFAPYIATWQNGLPNGLSQTDLCTGTYDFSVTDDFSCIAAGSIFISEQPDYFIDNVLITSPICFGETDGVIEVIEPTAVSYMLNPNAITNQTGIFNNLGAGQYDISVEDANGCFADTSVAFVSVSALIDIDPDFDLAQVCFQEVVDFSATAMGGSGGFTYNWYSCEQADAGCFISSTSPLSISIVQDTTVYVVAFDASGCPSDTVSLSAEFSSIINLYAGSPLATDSICQTECVNLEAGASGGNGNVDVVWIEISPQDSVVLSNSYTTTQCPMSDAVYLAIATDGCSPPVIDSVFVTVFVMPDSELDASVYEGCYPTTVEFFNLTDPQFTDNCVWSLGDGNTLPVCAGFEYTYASEGTYWPTLSVTSSDGCTNVDTLAVAIVIHGYPTAEFTWEPQPVTVLETEVQFFNQSVGGQIYSWDFSGLGDSNEENPIFDFPDLDLFQFPVCLSTVNEFGCEDTTCHTILMESILLVWVPNAFTPDNDDVNDYFLPVVRGFVPGTYNFKIFDRWGINIFETDNPSQAWIGNVNEGDHYVQEDVYIWQISLQELSSAEEKTFRGHVTIVR